MGTGLVWCQKCCPLNWWIPGKGKCNVGAQRWYECQTGVWPPTYQSIIHAGDTILVFATWTIVVTITEQTILDTSKSTQEIRCRTGEPFEALLCVIAFCLTMLFWFMIVGFRLWRLVDHDHDIYVPMNYVHLRTRISLRNHDHNPKISSEVNTGRSSDHWISSNERKVIVEINERKTLATNHKHDQRGRKNPQQASWSARLGGSLRPTD